MQTTQISLSANEIHTLHEVSCHNIMQGLMLKSTTLDGKMLVKDKMETVMVKFKVLSCH